jgi:hypothetical protein
MYYLILKKELLFLSLAVLFLPKNVASQESIAMPAIKLSGYVKNDMFFDSRQTVSAREGHFLLFPSAKVADQSGKDINAKPGFNFLAIQSNLSVGLSGPEAFGAKISGLIEGDFFGQSNADVNMLRLRHAYIKMQWKKTEILFGQYWHPLFVTSCFPATVSFNTGAPIQPFSRAPQLRISRLIKNLKISGTLLSQRDYASNGPDGVSSKYLRDSGIPEIQLSAELDIKRKNEFILGSGFGYKRLTPQIKTSRNYRTSETVSGISANAYMKFVFSKLTIKLEGVYLENGSEFLCLSGFAVRDTVNATKGTVKYIPVRTFSAWNEIHTNGRRVQFGIFSGYTRNLGTRDEINGPVYLTSNAKIKSLYRIAPRFSVYSGNLVFASEIEFTSAQYGEPDKHCIMIHTTRVDNLRLLISAIYKF